MEKPRENFSPQEQENLPSEPSSEQADKTDLDLEAEEKQIDIDQAAEEAAEDIVNELNLENKSAPPSEETRRSLTKRISHAIKQYWPHGSAGAVVGFAGASAARIAIKQGVLLYFGGMGAGAIAGAVAGAGIEGVRAIRRERKKFVAEDIIEQMNNARSPEEKAAIVAKAESALKEARISEPGKTSNLVDVVRATRLNLEAELEKDELQGKSQAQQISWLLKSAGRNLKEVPRSEKKNAKALLKKVEFASEKSKVDYKIVGKAVVRGALAGALGGAIGGVLSHYVFDNLHPGQWMEKAIEPIMESNLGISQEQAQAVAQEALRQKAEAAAAAAARVLEEGKQQILEENFTGQAKPGDGWTHLARKAVHDYMVNLRELSPESAPDLNMEQLVHIEDTIVKEQLKSGASELIHPGQKLELNGEYIQSLIDKAQELSPEKIQNISQVLAKPEHYLSPATIAEMTDYAEVAYADNDFARAVSERAQEAAKLAVAAVAEIAVPEAVSRAIPEPPETLSEKIPARAVETAKETTAYTKAILAVLAAGSLAGAGYAAKKVFEKKTTEVKEPETKEPVIEEPVPKASVAPAPAEVPPAPAPEEKIEEDKISPPQESMVAAAVAAGALAGVATAGAIASAEKKDEPAAQSLVTPPEVHPVSVPKIEITEDEPQDKKSALISKELKEISDKWGVPIEIEDPIYLRSDRRRKAIFEKLAIVADQLNQEDMNLLKKNVPKGILFSDNNLFDRNQQRIEISYGEGDDYILEHIKRSASDEEQEKLAQADAEFLIFKQKLETSYSLPINESEDMMGHTADRKMQMMDYTDRIISMLNKKEIDDLKIIAPNGIEIKTYGAHFNEIKKTMSIGESLPPTGKDKQKSKEQITIKEIREIIKKQLAAKKSRTSMPAVSDKTSANQENMEHFKKPGHGEEPPQEQDEEPIATETEKESGAPVVPPAAERAEFTEEQERVHAAAWYTLDKLTNYSELQTAEDGRALTTKEERQQRFVELVKKHWTEFTVHGAPNKKEIDPTTGKAKIERHSDLDANACLFLLKEAGIDVDSDAIQDAIQYVAPGAGAKTGIVLDTSGTFGVVSDKEGKRLTIDHHTAEAWREASATRFLYELLSDPGIGLLEKKPWFEKFVDYVSKEDSKNYTDKEAKDLWENYGYNFVSIAKENMTFEEMKKFFEEGKHTPYERLPKGYLNGLNLVYNSGRGDLREQKVGYATKRLSGHKKESLERIQAMTQQGFVLDTGDSHYGRILIDTGWKDENGYWEKKNRFEIDSARQLGYGGSLVWMPEQNQFFLKTVKQLDFEIPGAHTVRGHYILHGDVTEQLPVSLKDILAKLAGDPDYEIPGELKAALDSEVQMRGAIRDAEQKLSVLLAEKKLTQDQVNEAAKDLKDINFDTFNLLYRVLKTNAEAFALYQDLKEHPKQGQNKITVCFEALAEFNKLAKTAPAVKPSTSVATPAATSTPEATPAVENAPKPEKRDWWKVKRDTEVMAVEDLFGDMKYFEKHVATLGVAEKDPNGEWKWTGGDKKVVFLGDILGDRDMDGTKIVAIINDLAEQAEKQGGQVDALCGNHDMFFIQFLSHLETNEWGKRMAMDTGLAVGIWELAQFDPDPDSELKKINPKLNHDEFEQRKEELADKLYQRIPAILENMRTDPKGKKILEAICRIKIAAIHDDTLFCHTDPTQRMAVDLGRNDNIPARVAEVNRIFQENLRRVLFQSGKFDNDFQEIEEIYTNTNNREYFTILPFYQLGSNLLLEIVKNLHKKGEIQFTDTDYNFGSSDWGWKKEIINYLDYLSSSTEHIKINILTVEECIARWRQENDLIGDYTTEIVELFKMCADASKNKSDTWKKSTESLLDKFIEKISNLNTPEKYVQKVRNSGINTILHGHTPISENPNEKNPDYYNQEGLVISSVHGSERGISIIDKKGKINLTVTTVREQRPSV